MKICYQKEKKKKVRCNLCYYQLIIYSYSLLKVFCEDGGDSNTSEDNEFDFIVGALEEVLLDPSFETIKRKFCEEHCNIFDDKDENKIEYTEIFQKYTTLIESTLDQKLTEKVPNFSMKRFETMLLSRQDEMDTEIFDLLLSLSDFDEFKDVMLSYKKPVKASTNNNSNVGVFDFAITGSKPPK